LITPGERIYLLSLDGLKLGILIGVRATSICILISLITGTARFHTTLKAISKLGVPNKLVQLLIFTYRYIFVFVEEARKMLASAKARGFRKKTNIYTLKIIANLVGMLFIRGIEQTQSIYNAMISRGYKGDIKICDEFKLSVYDLLKAFLVISLALALHL
jgi:cobalt/nickel transport system permease protein